MSIPIPTQGHFLPLPNQYCQGHCLPHYINRRIPLLYDHPIKDDNAGFMQIVNSPNKNKESCLWTDQKGAEDVEGDEVDEGKLCSAAVAIGIGAVVAVWHWVTPDVHGVSTRQHDLLPRFTRCRPAQITHTQEVQRNNKKKISLLFCSSTHSCPSEYSTRQTGNSVQNYELQPLGDESVTLTVLSITHLH